MPPEVFIHYLNHKAKDSRPDHLVWTPRIPKRLKTRIITCGVLEFGWGIYIGEGVNRTFVLSTVLVTVICSVALCVLWSGIKGDLQGGTGLVSVE